jgi:L-amino acid N-acyltransferase YncA
MTLHALDLEHFASQLRSIYEVSLAAFSQNFLYTPLSWEKFFQQYERMRSMIDPRFVLLARQDDNVVGFVFALPDMLAIAAGREPSIIVKTLAVKADRTLAGLGNWLVDECHLRARQAGYSTAIHALQFDDNSSRKITARFGGTIFREYALFHKLLA